MTSRREEHIALLRAGIEAFNADDQGAVVEFFEPEVECVVGPGLVNTGTYRGHDGYLAMITSWNEAWAGSENQVVSVEAPDDHHVIAEIHQTATGSGSGVPVEMTVFYLLEVRDRRGVRFHIYADRESALAAIRK